MLTLQDIVDGLGRRLGVPVTLEDAQMRLLAHNAHDDEVDPARQRMILSRRAEDWARSWGREIGLYDTVEPIRIPLIPTRGVTARRVVVPIRWEGHLLGWLWLIEPEQGLGEEELAEARVAADHAAVILTRGRKADQQMRQARSEILRALLSADAGELAVAVQRVGDEGILRDGRLRVCTVDVAGTDAHARSRAEDAAMRVADLLQTGEGHALVRGSEVVLLVAARDPAVADGVRLGHRLREELGGGGQDLPIGVGGEVAGLADARRSHAQAAGAARVARVDPAHEVAVWERLGAYRALLSLPEPVDVTLLHPEVAALVDADDDLDLLVTVETFLDEGGKASRAAELLHVHRGTLYYRLKRFAELTGADLDDGAERLAVHLALKAVRLAGGLKRSA